MQDKTWSDFWIRVSRIVSSWRKPPKMWKVAFILCFYTVEDSPKKGLTATLYIVNTPFTIDGSKDVRIHHNVE